MYLRKYLDRLRNFCADVSRKINILEQSDFNGQSTGGKMEIGLEKPVLNNFKAYGWKK